MKLFKLNEGPYEIEVSVSNHHSLRTSDGSEWTDADTESCEIIMMQEIVKMRELLHQLNESTGPGAAEDAMMHAHLDIAEYINSIPK